jgi:hypothetical protein
MKEGEVRGEDGKMGRGSMERGCPAANGHQNKEGCLKTFWNIHIFSVKKILGEHSCVTSYLADI